MTWNWSANSRQKQRERFAGPLAIGGLVGMGLLLLIALYPEKTLRRLLNAPDVTTPAQQRYLEALTQLRSSDSNLLITLARSYLETGCPERAHATLKRLQGTLAADQSRRVAQLYYDIYRERLEQLSPEDPDWSGARHDFSTHIERLRQAGADRFALGRYLADARAAGDQETAARLEKLLGPVAAATAGSAKVDEAANAALAQGDYRAAAQIYFQAMAAAPPDDQRRLLLAGLRTLQAGNQLAEAMTAAERHHGIIGGDRQVLIYLTRLALAANRPDRAQIYIRKALGMAEAETGGTP